MIDPKRRCQLLQPYVLFPMTAANGKPLWCWYASNYFNFSLPLPFPTRQKLFLFFYQVSHAYLAPECQYLARQVLGTSGSFPSCSLQSKDHAQLCLTWQVTGSHLSNVQPFKAFFLLGKKNCFYLQVKGTELIDQKTDRSELVLSNIIRTVQGRSSLAYQRGIVSGDSSCALHTHQSACLPGHTVSKLSTYKASLYSYTSPTSCVLQDAFRTGSLHTSASIVYLAWYYLVICA